MLGLKPNKKPRLARGFLLAEIMLAGLFLQNYKCYSNLNFIPLTDHPKRKLNIFIGSNGAGKSAILDSLNCLLNDLNPKEWEVTLDKKKDRCSICPVFLLPKDNKIHDEENKLQSISDCFWEYDFSKIGNDKVTLRFIEFREQLKKNKINDTHYLIAIGKNYDGETLLTTTFHRTITNQTKRSGVSKAYIQKLLREILDNYSYIYIPVENKISDILSLQAQEMQSLMDKKIVEEIKSLLERKTQPDPGKGKQKSLLDLVNTELSSFTEEINSRMSEGYKFEPKNIYKKNIRSSDITNVILKEYFSIRPLTKDGKNIKSLSSGQQRLALIDVATTLLSTSNEKTREIILAVDEPESSLEPANCFDQFTQLTRISDDFKHQTLITTHWYGLLLKPFNGILSHIEPVENRSPETKHYPLSNIHEHRRNFPNSIEMKSYFDLMSSMLSILKKNTYHWILCEGLEDAKYIQTHASNKYDLSNFIILPFNGSGNIKKLYEFLLVPFSDEKENSEIKGSVTCLIDNDEKNANIISGYKAAKTNRKLNFYRLHLNREKDLSSIISAANPDATNTIIEDILDAETVWQSLQEIASSDAELKEHLSILNLSPNKKHSEISKSISFLEPKPNTDYLTAKTSLDEIQRLLSTQKYKSLLCHSYCKLVTPSVELTWLDELFKYIDKNQESEKSQ